MAVVDFFFKIAQLFGQNFLQLMQGLGETLRLTGLSLIIAFFVGVIFGLMRISRNKFLRGIAAGYVYLIRGIPLIVLAFFIYFGIGALFDRGIPKVTAGVITLTLNAGAYMTEIIRGGIQAVNKGQMEAARSLGLTRTRSMCYVVLPQAVRVVIPSLINQLIITLKDTTILSVIGVVELVQTGKIIIAANYESTAMWLIVALIYFILITILSKISEGLERRLVVRH